MYDILNDTGAMRKITLFIWILTLTICNFCGNDFWLLDGIAGAVKQGQGQAMSTTTL